AYVSAFLRIARVDARTFDPEEHEYRDEHRRADLVEEARLGHSRAAPEVRAKQVGLEGEDKDHDKGQDRENLGDRDDLVDESRLLTPPKDQEGEGPDADEATTIAVTVLPSPKTGKKAPSVALISTQ